MDLIIFIEEIIINDFFNKYDQIFVKQKISFFVQCEAWKFKHEIEIIMIEISFKNLLAKW